MLRKLKWQILAARCNWCQGPVPGRGPAVEKHWYRRTRGGAGLSFMASRILLHHPQISEYRLLCSPLSSWIPMTGSSYHCRLHNCNEQLPAFRRIWSSEYGDMLPPTTQRDTRPEYSPSLYRCDKYISLRHCSYPEPIKSKPCFSH
jgi:hypothetical protein